MFHRFLRLTLLATLLTTSTFRVFSLPCPDTEPLITGPDAVCASLTNVLTYTTPDVAGHSFSWAVARTSVGAGGWTVVGSTTNAQIDIRWTAPGNYRLTLTETVTATACSEVVTFDVTAQPFLISYFTYVATSECFNNIVDFHGDVSSPPAGDPTLSYEWTFSGNGFFFTSTLANPQVTFPNLPGKTYDATLKVSKTDAFGRVWEDAITDYIYVDPDRLKPTAICTVAPAGCLYDGINFDASASKPTHGPPTDPETITTFYYDFGDGTGIHQYPGTQTLVNYKYATPGTYNGTLTIINSKGCTSDVLPLPVVVANTVPVANFSNEKACLGHPTQFTDLSDPSFGSIASWSWNFDDPASTSYNTSTLPNPTHVFTDLSNYFPTLTVTNSLGCTHTYQTAIPVTVSRSPKADYTFNPLKVCEGQNVSFTDASDPQGGTPISTRLWDFAGQGTSNQPNAVWNFPLPGNYTVTLTITNEDLCSDVKTQTVIVYPKPALSYIVTPGTVSTLQILFDATSTPTVGNQIYWTFGDGKEGIGLHQDHTYDFPGTYDITVTARDMASSCETTVYGSVTVGAPPSANFAAQPPQQCQGVGITFIPADPGGVIWTDRYHYDDGKPDDYYDGTTPIPPPGSPTHIFDTPGPHTITRTVNEGLPTVDTKSVEVYIYVPPTAHFKWYADAGWTKENQACAGQDVYFRDLSSSSETPVSPIVARSWNFGDPGSGGTNNVSTLTNPSHKFSGNNTTYHVTLQATDANGCISSVTYDVFVNPEIPVDYTIPAVACVGQVITFQSTGMDPLTIATWTWDFGDGTGTSPDPISTTHAYMASAVGIRTTTLTVTDINGCSRSVSKDINVIPSPVAGFTYSSPICEGNSVQFTDESVPGNAPGDHITQWEWFWGDGSTPDPEIIPFGGNPNVTHTFPVTPGTYSWPVRLRVTNSYGCVNEIIINVNLLPAPLASFSTQLGTYQCAGQPVQFNDFSDPNGGGAITEWAWNFGDSPPGNTSTAQNPSHTYTADGLYTVTLIVKTANNCFSLPFTKDITVNKLPVSDFTFTMVCEGDPTVFTDNSTPNATGTLSYLWDFGGGNLSTLPSPTYTFGAAGLHAVSLRVTNSNGCIHSVTKQIMVNPKAIALFHYNDPSCANGTITFSSDSYIPVTPGSTASITSWDWTFGDGNTGTGPLVVHTYSDNLTAHTVTLTVTTSDGCISTIQNILTHSAAPIANISFTGYTCEKQTINFFGSYTSAGGIGIQTWLWNFSDPGSGPDNTSNLQNPVHDFSVPGTFDVTLIITDMNGCISAIKHSQVIIEAKPVAAFTAPPACLGAGTLFTDASTPAGGIATWLWQYDDGQQDFIQNPTHFFSTAGTHTVTLTVTTPAGCFKSITQQIEVYQKPVVSFQSTTPVCAGNEVTFTDLSTTAHGYITSRVWNFGDGPDQPPTPNPTITHTYTSGGNYTVTLTVSTSDGCTATRAVPIQIQYAPHADFYNSTTLCQGQNVQFTDASGPNGGGPVTSWAWDFGDPGSGTINQSTQQNPVHPFSVAGLHTITFRATNADGCYQEITRDITINARPLAQFSATNACLSSVTTFTDESTAPTGATITGHLWDFGDGGTSTATNPVYTFSLAGNHAVKLTVTTDQGCVKDTTIQVTVYEKPISSFSFNSPTCSTDSVYFHDDSSTPHGSVHEWVWSFGDGSGDVTRTYPESPDVAHKFPGGGTYNVRLTITTTDDCTAEKVLPVQVEFAPEANFNFTANACALTPVQFTDNSQQNGGAPIIHWEWDFGDPGSGTNNTSNVQSPTHAFTTGGPFDVNLIVTNANGCTDTIQKPVTVNNAPVAIFAADTACVMSHTQFTDQSTTTPGTIIAWSWNFGDPSSGGGNTSTLQNPTHDYNSPGTYTVVLTVTNSATCTKDTSMQVSVNPKPVALFEYSASCVGDSTQFTDLSIAPNSSVTAWLWDFGDGTTTVTVQNPKHAFLTSGTFQVKLIVTNLSNCKDSVIIPVVTRPKPTAAFASVNFFCPAGQVSFQDQSTGSGSAITDHYWIFEPGSVSTLVNPTYVFPVTDMKYWVQLIVTDNYGCKDTIGDSVYVKPGFSFSFSNDTVCLGYPTHFSSINNAEGDSLYSVVWNFGDPNSGSSNTSYLYNPTHVFTQPGLYSVKMKAWNSDNCVDSVYRDIQVFAPPVTAFAFQTQPCDSTIYFADTTSNPGTGTIASWEWRFGDGTPPLIIPAPGPGDTSHLYVNPGIYPVTLIITNTNGCVDSLTQNVQRFPCIRAVFEYPDTLRCARYQISFSDSSLPVQRINQWHWTWGDGQDTLYTAHGTPITHIYADSGTYAVTLAIEALVNGVNIKDSVTRLVTIHPTPYSLFSNIGVCLKQPTVFLDTSTTFGVPMSTWSWHFGEPTSGVNDTSTRQNPTHKYMDKGYYDVKLLVMNKFGCEDSLTKTTRVYGLPIAHFNNSVACTGDPTYFTDNSSISDTTAGFWAWNFGDPNSDKDTSNLQEPIYRYRSEGDFPVRFIVKDYFGCMDTVDSTVRVNITPTSAFTFTENFDGRQGKVKLNNQSNGATLYNWDFGNGTTSTEDNPIISYTEDGTYIIKLIALNQFECSDTTFFEYNLLFKGLYVPNAFSPTNTILAVRLFQPVGMNLKQYHVTVFDQWGHIMWESSALDDKGRPSEGWDGTYEGEIMPQGNYMWKIKALFVDDSPWNGSDIGMGEYSTMGTVTLIR